MNPKVGKKLENACIFLVFLDYILSCLSNLIILVMIIPFLFQKLVYIYLEHLLLYVQVRMFCINNLIISYNFHLYFYLNKRV